MGQTLEDHEASVPSSGPGRPLKGWDTRRGAVLKDRFGSFLDDGLDRGWRWVQARDESRKTGEEALVRG